MNEINVKDLEGEIEPTKSRHSRWTFASFNIHQFSGNFAGISQMVFLFFYYEVFLGLDAYLIFLTLSAFTIYDALNDPLMGYLTDRNFKWTKKWGRRFPWIVIGAVPWCLSIYLIYSAPDVDASVNPLPVVLWLFMSLFIFDTFGTLVGINVLALRVDKFRTESERRTSQGYWAFVDMISQVLGMLIPPLFLGAGQSRADFALMGALLMTVGLVSAALYLPGMREDKIIIERYYSADYERMNFFKGAKEVVKQKSFIVYFISQLTWTIATTLLTANSIYLIYFVVRATPDVMTLIFAFLLTGALISIPIWLKVIKKFKDTKKVIVIGGFVASFTMIPISFFQTMIQLYVFIFILGICLGSMWTFWPLVTANVFDDYVVRTEKNQKGIMIGVSAVLGRLVATIDELIFAVVHDLTGFIGGHTTYQGLEAAVTDAGGDMNLVLWGIRSLSGFIPWIILLLGTLFFWKFYPLDQKKVMENKVKLKELGF